MHLKAKDPEKLENRLLKDFLTNTPLYFKLVKRLGKSYGALLKNIIDSKVKEKRKCR